MGDIELNILGCGSAQPTSRHNPAAQVLSVRDNLFMIDCGEGTQLQFRKMKLKFSRLYHIFISHLHGDHCFGLPGLLSTMALLGQAGEVNVYAPAGTEAQFRPILNFFCKESPLNVKFHELDAFTSEVIFEDKTMRVSTIPLKHRIPTIGYLFQEKDKPRHLIREMIDFYQIPIRELQNIKWGGDFVTPEGDIIPNARLTRDADKTFSYAYCSDTAYSEKIIPYIAGIDYLYHEATFADEQKARAKQTFHSTASQAAEIARKAKVGQLIIGHFSARYDNEDQLLEEARKIFPNTMAADERLKLKF